jgi:hypothetical protein
VEGLTDPAKHCKHILIPVSGAKLPAGQKEHSELADTFTNRPVTQGEHDFWPVSGLTEPMAQTEQLVLRLSSL